MTSGVPAPARRDTFRAALLALGSVMLALAGLAALHWLLASGDDGLPALLVAIAWLAVCAVAASLGSNRPLAGLLATAAAVGVALHYRSNLASRVDLVYLAQHAGTHLCLGAWFASTLAESRAPPLITRLATRIHGPLPLPIQHYTRRVTVLWTGYFLGMALLSVAVFLAAPLASWSVLANLLTLPLVIAIFIGEYLWRLRRFPDFEHSSLLDGIRAYLR